MESFELYLGQPKLVVTTSFKLCQAIIRLHNQVQLRQTWVFDSSTTLLIFTIYISVTTRLGIVVSGTSSSLFTQESFTLQFIVSFNLMQPLHNYPQTQVIRTWILP